MRVRVTHAHAVNLGAHFVYEPLMEHSRGDSADAKSPYRSFNPVVSLFFFFLPTKRSQALSLRAYYLHVCLLGA